MATKIFNLIILDESGSMNCIRKQTIDGCNETINTVKSAQKKFDGEQDHYISIYAFQGNRNRPSHFIIKNMAAADVRHISETDYEPCGCTPLYDAVGSTLTDLMATTQTHDDAIGSVTIITDGYENSSTDYTLSKVAKMISELKEKGWNFNFIGANINVERTAAALNIDNHLKFDQTEDGTREMFAHANAGRIYYFDRLHESEADIDRRIESEKERAARRKGISLGFFKRKH